MFIHSWAICMHHDKNASLKILNNIYWMNKANSVFLLLIREDSDCRLANIVSHLTDVYWALTSHQVYCGYSPDESENALLHGAHFPVGAKDKLFNCAVWDHWKHKWNSNYWCLNVTKDYTAGEI